ALFDQQADELRRAEPALASHMLRLPARGGLQQLGEQGVGRSLRRLFTGQQGGDGAVRRDEGALVVVSAGSLGDRGFLAARVAVPGGQQLQPFLAPAEGVEASFALGTLGEQVAQDLWITGWAGGPGGVPQEPFEVAYTRMIVEHGAPLKPQKSKK